MNGPDFTVIHGGSIFILRAVTAAAREWAAENLPDDATRLAGGIVVEPRYLSNILEGIAADGLTFL